VLVVEESGATVTTGYIRPRIVVPVRLIASLTERDLHSILLHEEHHRRRRDPLRYLFLRFSHALFFLYPPIHIILPRLYESTEYACDEGVVASGVDPASYLGALARAVRTELSPHSLIPAAGGTRSIMTKRLSRLSHPWRYTMSWKYSALLVSVLLIVIGCSMLPLASRAGDEKEIEAIELDKMPQPIMESMVQPVYPKEALKEGIEGKVLLKVAIDEKGMVTAVEIQEEVPDHPELGKAATEAVEQWRFVPGEIKGKPVASEVLIPVQFKLH
jgi:TonB family protein